jgi:hypothetical protein
MYMYRHIVFRYILTLSIDDFSVEEYSFTAEECSFTAEEGSFIEALMEDLLTTVFT